MNFDWNLSKLGCGSILIIVVAAITICVMCIWCKMLKSEGRAVYNDYWYVIAKIDGHDYIIGGIDGCRGAGLTHSESCPCKKGKIDYVD